MNIEIEIFVMEKILFCSVIYYWPAIEKLFNSGTYLLRKTDVHRPLILRPPGARSLRWLRNDNCWRTRKKCKKRKVCRRHKRKRRRSALRLPGGAMLRGSRQRIVCHTPGCANLMERWWTVSNWCRVQYCTWTTIMCARLVHIHAYVASLNALQRKYSNINKRKLKI